MISSLAIVLLCFGSYELKTLHPNVFKFEDNSIGESAVPPPDHTEYAKMARWIVHNMEWTSMGTISTVPSISGFPMVNVIAFADSSKDAPSTGVIYFYLTMLDFTAQDLAKNNRLTTLFSMEQSLYCSQKMKVDPMEPTCARIMISGNALRIRNETEEFKFATAAMISHHPASVNWLKTHNFFLCKLNISQIAVLDWYGGPHFVDTKDYYKVTLDGEDNSFELENQDDNEIPMYYLPEDTNDSDEVVDNKVESKDNTKTFRIILNKNSNFDEVQIEI
ncbi:unnamed protein product [Diamesa serratosioi]